MKTFNSLRNTTKNALFVLSLIFVTALSAKAQPLYTQDVSYQNACDGFAYLDSAAVFQPVVWTNASTGSIISPWTDYYSVYYLCPGDYTVSFNDINNNALTVAFTIGNSSAPNPCNGFSATMNTTNTDANSCTGTATITPVGGTAPYNYTWYSIGGGPMLSTLSNLCSGTYSGIVFDANGCSATVSGFVDVIPNPCQGFSATMTTTNSDLNDCTGSVTLTVSGGTAPYSITSNNSNISLNTLTDVCVGNYWAAITDANGCYTTASGFVDLNNSGGGPTPIDTNIVNLLITQDATGYNTCDGYAYIDSTNLTNPNAYQQLAWYNVTTGTPVLFNAFWLCPGDYMVTITTIDGSSTTLFFTIGNSGNPNPCAGFTTSLTTTFSDVNDCTGTATALVSGGTAPYVYNWSNSGNATLNTQENLCPGVYSVEVVDATGCNAYAWDSVFVDNSGGTNPGDTIIVFLNNTFPPNAVTDSLPTTIILDCNIVFDSIGSAMITNVVEIPVGIVVTWTIYDFNGFVMATYDVPYYNINPTNSVYEATLVIMCGRSINGVQITDQFEYMPSSANIAEQAAFNYTIVNPMTDDLTIQFNQPFEGQLTLIDMKGAVIFAQSVSGTNFQRNVADLSQGMYLLQIQSQHGISSARLMK
jgi:hypothetical protein